MERYAFSATDVKEQQPIVVDDPPPGLLLRLRGPKLRANCLPESRFPNKHGTPIKFLYKKVNRTLIQIGYWFFQSLESANCLSRSIDQVFDLEGDDLWAGGMENEFFMW